MSDYTKPIRPVITGTPDIRQQRKPAAVQQSPSAFSDMIKARLQTQTQEITFSKHAQQRAQQRGVNLTEQDIQRLGEAAQKAQEKGIRDTLVMMNHNAFIINVPSRVVVTMVDSGDNETVFTNIDGAVIV